MKETNRGKRAERSSLGREKALGSVRKREKDGRREKGSESMAADCDTLLHTALFPVGPHEDYEP